MEKSPVEDNSWIIELETALLADCDLAVLQKICNQKLVPAKLRPEFWQACLDIKGKKVAFEEFFDLQEQSLIRSDCQKLVETLGNEELDKVSVLSDIESIVTTYSKSNGLKYHSDNGWLQIIQPLIALKIPKTDIYSCFEAILTKYIPRCFNRVFEDGEEMSPTISGQPFHLLRLLLLYHDPDLCSFLDTKKLTPDLYAVSWFRSLFSAHCDIRVTHAVWDVYFQSADPFLVFFLALVMLVNAKEQILEMKTESRESIIETLNSVPSALDIEDISDLFYLLKNYVSQTPASIKDFYPLVYEASPEDSLSRGKDLAQALCLPVPVSDLLPNAKSGVRYFVVDCRPAEQYNNGHLSTAFHLDCSLMLQEPSAFNVAVDALLAAQKQAIDAGSVAGGKHLCFMGSGRDEEDRYVHMVVASFLQKQHQFVSLADGGYGALHQALTTKSEFEKCLIDHNKKKCLACLFPPTAATRSEARSPVNGASTNSTSLFGANSSGGDIEHFTNASNSIFDKVATVVKSKSKEMKGKLVDYITNPNQQTERHVSSKDKLGKRYKGFTRFSIVDDNDDGLDVSDDEKNQEIDVDSWAKGPDFLGCFRCQEIKDDGYMYQSYLVLSKTHLYILREIAHNKGFAKLTTKRPLEMIVQITSKRRCPDLITFKYGESHEGSESAPSVIATDLLLIPKPYEVTRLVKQQVIKVLDGDPNAASVGPPGKVPNS